MDVAAIPLFDHHCHALCRPGAPLDGPAFRRHFSESTDPAMAPHLSSSLFYRRALRDLAALLGCEPNEESILAARQSLAPEEYEGSNAAGYLDTAAYGLPPQSTIAAVGMSFASRIIILTCRDVSVMTATFVASLPVPAVVGIATRGGPGFGMRWYP